MPSAFFFVNLFVHIGVPLVMGAILWLHVSHLARPTLLPPKRLAWTIVGALTATAVLAPATLGPAADAFRLWPSTPLDLVAAWWLPRSERLTPSAAWSAALVVALVMLLVPRFTRRRRDGAWAPSVVDPKLCTGCNQCPQDCPWDAITMVKRADDRPTLVALVDPARCVSCGICAGSCAPMGVGRPGRTGRDQLAVLRDGLLPALAFQSSPSIVAICCEQAPRSHAAALQERGAYLHMVTCVGNLHSSVVERVLRERVLGVIVCGCPSRECLSREGPEWLDERLFHDREAELQARVDRRRVRVATFETGALRESIAAFESFARDVSALRRPVQQQDAEVDVVCEPVPFVEEAR